MGVLSNFQLKNQRITPTSNGAVDINADFDCVPTCIAAALQFLTGLKFEGGILKEICYGMNYQGGTAASAYVQYAAQHGVHLYPLQGSNDELIAAAHYQVKEGHPVIVTIPDPYIDLARFPGYSHVLALFGEDTTNGALTALDPFIAQAVTRSDYAWAGLLQFGEIWILEKVKEEEMIISLDTPGVRSYYGQTQGNAWKSKNGFIVGNAILSFYRMFGNSALCGLSYLGLPTSNERGIPGKTGVVEQDFERATVRYDPAHLMDNPPGSGPVYLVHQRSAQPVQTVVDPQAQARCLELQKKIESIQEIVKA